MFRRRRFRRFRAGRRRRFSALEKRNNYIEIGQLEIAEAANDTFTLLTGADAVTNAISNDTTVADCEKGSKVIGGKVHVLYSIAETGQPARLIAYALYKDSAFGQDTDMTDISTVYSPSTSTAVANLKRYTVAKGKFLMGDQSDKYTQLFGPRILRKIGKLREGESIKLFIQNETSIATRAINVALHGHITTIK